MIRNDVPAHCQPSKPHEVKVPVRIDVIIVTYNSAGDILQCLESIHQNADVSPDRPLGRMQITVVDNQSTDDTVPFVREYYRGVRLVQSPFNRGFGSGVNQGISRAEGDYCLILNPDVVLKPGCIGTLAEFLNRNPNAGCVGPAILDKAGRYLISHYPFLNLWLSVWQAFGLQKLLPVNRIDGKWELRYRAPSQPHKVDRLLGAVFLVRRSLLNMLNGFDERYFLYSEEEDLCRRIAAAGYGVHYLPNARAVHRGAGSIGAVNPLAAAASNWSRCLYMRKFYPGLTSELSRWMWIIGIVLRMILVTILLPVHWGRNFKPVMQGYYFSLVSLLKPGWFDRQLRPRKSDNLRDSHSHEGGNPSRSDLFLP